MAKIVMQELEDDRVYKSADGWSMAREDGLTPNGNPVGGRWVVRNPQGEFQDVSQYRNDLANQFNFELIDNV